MSKYKVGDKVILTVTGLNDKVYYPYYEFNNNKSNLWQLNVDEYAEPHTTYTETLETKIENLKKKLKRWVEKCANQSTEITRLLAENEKLKAENGNVIWEIEQAFDRGCNAAWKLAQKIIATHGYSLEEIEGIFGTKNARACLLNYTYSEAAAKVAEWERKNKEICVGDVVSIKNANIYGVVTYKDTSDNTMDVIAQNGNLFFVEKEDCTKTGKHIDINEWLKQIGGENNE